VQQPTSRHRPRPLAGALALAYLAVSCDTGGSGSEAPVIGTVTVISSTTCPSGPGNLPNTTCMQLQVDSLSNPPIGVELRVLEPAPGVPQIGTVLFGIGGDGTDFYTAKAGGTELFVNLLALGFRIVDRRWETGWYSTGTSVREQSARYATLLTWVHDQLHTTGVFCASGNSAGSAEIAYALTTWGAGSLLDAAALSGGPPLSRLDYLCEDPPGAAWTVQCVSIVPPGALSCATWECTASGTNLCSLLPPGATSQELEADSILHPAAQLDFPTTALSILIGDWDCGVAPPQALLFEQAVTSPTTLQFVPGGAHYLASTQQGRDAIVMALLAAVPSTTAEQPYWRVRVVLLELP
jgi:hypothetical protein